MEELIPIFFFMSVAAVLILRPLTKRLGLLLEAVARNRMGPPPNIEVSDSVELARMRSLLDHVARRIDTLDERLDFTERLLTQRAGRLDGPRLEPVVGARRGQDADYLAR